MTFETPQQLYDELVNRTRSGLLPCAVVDDQSGRTKCLYRFDGTPECQQRCVAGIFMRDDEYSPEFDRKQQGVLFLNRDYPDAFEQPEWLSDKQLSELQNAHDIAADSFLKQDLDFGPNFVERLNDMSVFAEVDMVGPSALQTTKERSDG
jgi:hypothetical protein